ncbi:hypothetical protein IWW47_003553 [Coemansia sp. RSA 2052]|nr:hypothetical protein IWW47_003553 [Coemansia sp. RSA 2052]
MQDPQLVLPRSSYVAAADTAGEMKVRFGAIEAACPFPPAHLITELMRRLEMMFEEFVKETIRAVRVSSPTKNRIDPCISPLLRHLPEQPQMASDAANQEPDWFKYAPGYLRSAWKRLIRTYKTTSTTTSNQSRPSSSNTTTT